MHIGVPLIDFRNRIDWNDTDHALSQFDCAYDAAGRRIAVTRSGTAFGDLSGATDRYACNARGEVTGAGLGRD